jgi:rhodanese-related sulfurtransferase
MSIAAISPKALSDLIRSGRAVDLIDVRTPAEYQSIHAEQARSTPLDTLDPAQVLASRAGKADEPIYFICKAGTRAGKACEKMAAAGFARAVNVEGGTDAWAAAGLPVVRGQSTMSLERQVRIAAGSLVLLGLLLAWILHPVFALLSAFVGGGLVYSGVSDTCGMGMILAKAPWNQS